MATFASSAIRGSDDLVERPDRLDDASAPDPAGCRRLRARAAGRRRRRRRRPRRRGSRRPRRVEVQHVVGADRLLGEVMVLVLHRAGRARPWTPSATEILAALGVGLETSPMSSERARGAPAHSRLGSADTQKRQLGSRLPGLTLDSLQRPGTPRRGRSCRGRRAAGWPRGSTARPRAPPSPCRRARSRRRAVPASRARVYFSARSTVPGGSFLTEPSAPRT